MGKQHQKKNARSTRPASVNSVDWEWVALELVTAGICSPLIPDYRDHQNKGKNK